MPQPITPPISRRQTLAVGGALACGYFVNPARGEILNYNTLRPDQHACVEQPVFNPNDSAETRSRSPTELAIMLQDNTLAQLAPATSAQFAAKEFPASIQSAPQRAAFASHWTEDLIPGKVFRLFFLPNSIDRRPVPAGLQKKVLDHAKGWSEYIDLDFDITPDINKSHARIECSRLLGHSSYIGLDGNREQGRRTMTLGFSDETDFDSQGRYSNFVVLHEVGHAIGLIHEHNRQDADLPFDQAATIAYFAGRGLNADQVRFNIFERWTKPLIKSTSYDSKSIMHYMFPDHIMKTGRGIPQNYVLSKLDVELAQVMYGRRKPPPDDDGITAKTEQVNRAPLPLTLDGDPVSARLGPSRTQDFSLKVAADKANKPYTIVTQGSTQVVLQLLGPGDFKVNATPENAPDHGTYDLTNDVIQTVLKEGEFIVRVLHVSPRGGGSFRLAAISGRTFARLLRPNRVMP